MDPGLLPGQGCPDPTNPICVTLAPFDFPDAAGGQGSTISTGAPTLSSTRSTRRIPLPADVWSVSLGLRGDFYNGLQAVSRQAEPRGGVAYNIKKTNTVLRISYARALESPFNENLILSGTGCTDPVVNAIMTVGQGLACATAPLSPGFRNEFHAGLQQAFGKYFVLSGDYIWKYTHNSYDFNVFGTTPVFLPIEWAKVQDSRLCRSRKSS